MAILVDEEKLRKLMSNVLYPETIDYIIQECQKPDKKPLDNEG